MELPKNKIREILQRSITGKKITGKDKKEGYLISFLFLFIIIIFLVPVYIIVLKVLPISFSETVNFSIRISIVVILGFFFFYLFYWKTVSSGRKHNELASLENIRENESKELICEILGKKIYFELNPNANPMNVYQTNLCNELLKQDEVKNNNELKFHIYNKLYKFHFIDEEFNKATEALRSALEIKPSEIITSICLAETYEYVGNEEKAINTYEMTKITCSLSPKLINYINDQIIRVRREGPRKEPPITGLRYNDLLKIFSITSGFTKDREGHAACEPQRYTLWILRN